MGFDIFVSFWGPTLYGHTITSWEFDDGRHLAVSIETRSEQGEDYSALRGFFRQYELYYVMADERDLIALRTNHRGETVHLYPVRAPPDKGRGLLLDFVVAINAIAAQPRWYNALTHNCTTTIWHHAKAVGSRSPFDWRLLANGYLADLAYERGTVNTSIGLAELKRRSDITERARSVRDPEDFSKAIRDGLPPRPPGRYCGCRAASTLRRKWGIGRSIWKQLAPSPSGDTTMHPNHGVSPRPRAPSPWGPLLGTRCQYPAYKRAALAADPRCRAQGQH
jgi:hypothetical protein